jgi:hypothetical protein
MDIETYISNQHVPEWVKAILRKNLTSIPIYKDELYQDSDIVKRNIYFNWNNISQCIHLTDMIKEEQDLSILYNNFDDPIILLTYISQNVMNDPHCGCMGRKIGDFEIWELKETTEYFIKMFKKIYNIDIQTYEDILKKRNLYHLSNSILFNLIRAYIEEDPFIIIKILTIQNDSTYLSFSSGNEEDDE